MICRRQNKNIAILQLNIQYCNSQERLDLGGGHLVAEIFWPILADFLSTRTGHVRVLPLYFTTLLLETIWY